MNIMKQFDKAGGIVLMLGMAMISQADVVLTFGSAADLDNFSGTSTLTHDPSGGSNNDGSMSLQLASLKSAYLTSETIGLSQTGASATMTLDLGPLVLGGDVEHKTIGYLGLIPTTGVGVDLGNNTTQTPRFSVYLKTYTGVGVDDCQLILENLDSGRTVSSGTAATITDGNYYRWIFSVTSQGSDNYLLESELIDLGADGSESTQALTASWTASNSQMGSLDLYSGIGRGDITTYYMNQVDTYQLTTALPEPATFGLVGITGLCLLVLRRNMRG